TAVIDDQMIVDEQPRPIVGRRREAILIRASDRDETGPDDAVGFRRMPAPSPRHLRRRRQWVVLRQEGQSGEPGVGVVPGGKAVPARDSRADGAEKNPTERGGNEQRQRPPIPDGGVRHVSPAASEKLSG